MLATWLRTLWLGSVGAARVAIRSRLERTEGIIYKFYRVSISFPSICIQHRASRFALLLY